MVLNGEFGHYPHLYGPTGDMSGFTLMFVCILLSMIVATWICAKAYEGGSGPREAVQFGIVLGVLMGLYISGTHFGTMAIGKKLARTYAIGEFGEFLFAGLAIGLVYRPPARLPRGRPEYD